VLTAYATNSVAKRLPLIAQQILNKKKNTGLVPRQALVWTAATSSETAPASPRPGSDVRRRSPAPFLSRPAQSAGIEMHTSSDHAEAQTSRDKGGRLDGCDVQRNGAGVSTARLRRPAQSAGAVSLTSCAKRGHRDAHELRPRGGPNVPRQRRASGRLRRPAKRRRLFHGQAPTSGAERRRRFSHVLRKARA
jgi:hypothetical protein